MQIVKLNRRGNSLGVNVPTTYLRQLGWGVGVCLIVEIEHGALTFRPVPYKQFMRCQHTDQLPEALHATNQG